MVAVMWAAEWLGVGALIGWPLRWFDGPLAERLVTVLASWTMLGALSGFVFALLLAWREQGQTVDSLRPSRLFLWGIVAGAGVPLLLCVALVLALPDSYLTIASGGMFALMGGVGAGSGFVTLRLAQTRRAGSNAVAPPA